MDEANKLPEPVATLHARAFDDKAGPRMFQVVDSIAWHRFPGPGSYRVFTADQLRQAMEQARMEERERCAQVAEGVRASADPDDPMRRTALGIATAIRSGA